MSLNKRYKFDTGIVRTDNSDGCVTWTIDKFYSLPLDVGCEIQSPEFVLGDSRYTLVVWPRGRKGDTGEWLGVCLFRKVDESGSCDSVQFSIVSRFGNIKTSTVECSENNIFMQERFIEWSDFRALNDTITPNGCLTIHCRLDVESREETPRQHGNFREEYGRPLNDPKVKFQCGEYHSPDPLSISPSFRIIYPDTQISSSSENYGSPSTINSFYSTSTSFEKSFENIPESTEAKDSDFKLPYAVAGAEPGNTLWNSFTRGIFRGSKAKKADAIPDTTEDIPERSTSESAQDSPIIMNDTNSTKNAEVIQSKPAESTNIDSSKSMKTSNSSTPDVKKGEETESQNAAESQSLPILSSSKDFFEGFVTNSTTKSTPKSNQHEGSLPASTSYLKGLMVLSQHYENLYTEGKNFDLIIIMEGKEFKVLRGILIERSPVFKQLLSEDTGKNTSNIINIDSFGACDSSVFDCFLLYIYSGKIKNLTHKNVYGLYCAACKFEVLELKEECVEILKMSLSIETITDVLRFVNNESELEQVALVFLAKNMKIIMHSDEWKQFMREDTDRAVEYHSKALDIGYVKIIE